MKQYCMLLLLGLIVLYTLIFLCVMALYTFVVSLQKETVTKFKNKLFLSVLRKFQMGRWVWLYFPLIHISFEMISPKTTVHFLTPQILFNYGGILAHQIFSSGTCCPPHTNLLPSFSYLLGGVC